MLRRRPSRSRGFALLGRAVGAGLEVALADPGRFTHALAQVIQLRAPHGAGAFHLDLGNLRGIDREDALDTFALDDAADGEHLAGSFAPPADHRATEDLDALL